MLPLQISSLCCPPTQNSYLGKLHSQKNIVSSFGTSKTNKIRSSQKNGRSSVHYNGGIYTSLLHQDTLESERPLAVESSGNGGGIGITDFFQGKNIFITGATGFLGKALVEKLLRSTSVGKIYVLLKANDKENALDRLSKEIIESELFESIRVKHGKSYDKLLREKLIPIVGNICEPNLGMDAYSTNAIMDEVDVIIESAAITAFKDRYDLLINANVNAPQRLMMLAKRFKNLKLFVHISTAYVNGKREGIIYEKPLVMGGNGRKEGDDVPSNNWSSSSSHDGADVANEINLAMQSCISSADSDVTKELINLGVERAEYLGWNNTYSLTKAMGEMILNEIRGDVPLLIIRPTIIEGSYNEPVPGWIQGHSRMADPVIISYGKGLLPAYFADSNVHVDIVPVDMVVSTTVAAIAKHGRVDRKRDELLNVYHVATGYVNPLLSSDIFDYAYEHFAADPLARSKCISSTHVKKIKIFDEFDDFSKCIRDEATSEMRRNAVGINEKTLRKLEKQSKAKVAYAEELCKMYAFIGFFKARFHTGNTRKLLEEMSEEERVNFEVDATKIDWRKYFVEIHIPGLRRHLLR